MKVYTHIVMDMTQEHVPVIEEESFSYDGEVSLCSGGGGGDSGAPDWYYDRQMNLAEKQQELSDEQWNLYKHGQTDGIEKQKQYKVGDQWMGADEARNTLEGGSTGPTSLEDLETKNEVYGGRGRGRRNRTKYKVGDTWLNKEDAKAAIAGNTGGNVDLTEYASRTVTNDKGNTSQLDVEQEKLDATMGLIDPMANNMEDKLDFAQEKRDVQREGLGLQSDMISKKKGILSDMGSFGVDSRMNTAEADVEQQFRQNQEEAKRSMSRMGVDPTSGKFRDMETDMALEKASAEAGARNQTRSKTKQMGFGLMGG